jgi:uncharacterized membrane-anchored protein YhcB (DUF1043 family)
MTLWHKYWFHTIVAGMLIGFVSYLAAPSKAGSQARSEIQEHTRALEQHTRALERHTSALEDNTEAMEKYVRKCD